MTTTRVPTRRKTRWRVPTGLILLSVVPVLAGAIRVAQLTGGAVVTPENERFVNSPVPVLLHIVGASTYLVLGALQFVPRLRGFAWHRVAGRLLVPCGLIAALSGLWMTLFYPRPPGDGDLLTAFRLLFGVGMAVAIVLGYTTIRRRNVLAHRAWMMRGYAIGLGAGTQALTTGIWVVIVGTPGEFARAMVLGAGWVINLAVAEWFIRGRRVR